MTFILSPLQPLNGVGCRAFWAACYTTFRQVKLISESSSCPAELQAEVHLVLALAKQLLDVEEASDLLLGSMWDVEPDPITGQSDAARAPKEGEVVQVLPQICRPAAMRNESQICTAAFCGQFYRLGAGHSALHYHAASITASICRPAALTPRV